MTAPGAPRIVVVTGASGMIGRHLCDRLRREGWVVRAMMRNVEAYPFAEPGIARFRLRLPDDVDDAAFAGAEVVVHAAHATRGGSAKSLRRVNEASTARIVAAAHRAGARVVFLSTFSVATGARSDYAESKRAGERMLDPQRDLVVRPGFVLAADGGMVRRLWDAIMAFHAVPIFGGGEQVVQTVHIDDLCAVLVRAVASNLTGTMHVAETDGLTMRDMLRQMARAVETRCVLVPLPTRPVAALLRMAESVGVRLPLTRDNVQGMVALRHVDTRADLARLSVHVRPAAESIAQLASRVRGR
jgi:nucleoside-diphosphate-sugar epimerase